MNRYLSVKFYAKRLTVWKILKNGKTASNFGFPCSERLLFYGLLWANWHGQIYPDQQNAKEITLQSLKITIR